MTNRPGTVTVTKRPGTVTVTLIKSGTVTVTPEASLTLNIAQVRLLNSHCHCHLLQIHQVSCQLGRPSCLVVVGMSADMEKRKCLAVNDHRPSVFKETSKLGQCLSARRINLHIC